MEMAAKCRRGRVESCPFVDSRLTLQVRSTRNKCTNRRTWSCRDTVKGGGSCIKQQRHTVPLCLPKTANE